MERFGAGGGASRRSLVEAKRLKSVILWNEFVPVGKNGLAEGKFSLPDDFTGELRFMAVAVEGNSFGARKVRLSWHRPCSPSFRCLALSLRGISFSHR